MEKKSSKPMTPFDELTVSPELQIIKLLLPYTPPSNQKMLGILVKFLELQHTARLFQNFTLKTQSQTSGRTPPSFADILEEISPYLPAQGTQMLHSFREMMNMMELFQMFQETSASSENNNNTAPTFGVFNPMDIMKGMLSPEQQEMFQMYQSMFDQEGDKTNGRMDEQSSSKEYRSDEVRTHSDGSIEDSGQIRKGTDANHDGSDYEC